MVTTQRSRRGGLFWAILGGLVLIAGIVAIIVVPLAGRPAPTATPTPGVTSTSGSPTPSGSVGGDGEFVDPSVTAQGWVPEPITTDPETYIRAALAAASTFDTTKSSRDDWLTYLDGWFTPDTRYSAADQPERMQSAQLELRQGVVLPQEEWDSLASEDGRVVAVVTGRRRTTRTCG